MSEMHMMKCDCCDGYMYSDGTYETLVGYSSPPGHDHDDNCQERFYVCQCGRDMLLSRRNTCPACDWKGKDECFCHDGRKIAEWPRAKQ